MIWSPLQWLAVYNHWGRIQASRTHFPWFIWKVICSCCWREICPSGKCVRGHIFLGNPVYWTGYTVLPSTRCPSCNLYVTMRFYLIPPQSLTSYCSNCRWHYLWWHKRHSFSTLWLITCTYYKIEILHAIKHGACDLINACCHMSIKCW